MTSLTSAFNKVASGVQTVSVGNAQSQVKTISNPMNAIKVGGVNTFQTLSISTIPSTFFSGTNSYDVVITKGTVDRVEDFRFKFRFTITAGGNVIMPPLPWWFSRIDILTNPGNKLHQTMFADTLWSNLIATHTDDQLRVALERINVDSDIPTFLSVGDPLTQGQEYELTLSLPGAFFAQLDGAFGPQPGNIRGIQEDIIFRFYPNIVAAIGSQALTSITLNSLSVIVASADLDQSQSERKIAEQYSQGFAPMCRYLDVVQNTFAAQNLKPGTTTRVDIGTGVSGQCPHLFVVIRPAGTTAMNSYARSISIGPDSTFDLQDAGQQSLLGNGTAVQTDVWRLQNTYHVRNDMLTTKKGYYLLPFSDSTSNAIKGGIHGYFEFDNDKYMLAITPAAGRAERHTITASGNVTSGVFSVWLPNGEFVGSFIGGTSTATNLKDAIVATKFAQRSGWVAANISVSHAALFNSTTTFYVDIADPEGNFLKKPLIVTSGIATITMSTAVTTAGKGGLFEVGATTPATGNVPCDIYVYQYMVKRAMYNPRWGSITTQLDASK